MSAPTREQVQAWARDARVELNFTMHRSGPIGAFHLDEFMRLMSAAYVAGQTAERAKLLPAPMVVDMSHIDAAALKDLMARSRHVGVLHAVPDRAIVAAVAAEREACADMADELDDCMPGNPFGKLAAAIRTRGTP